MKKVDFFRNNLIVTISDFKEMKKNGRISGDAYLALFHGHKNDKIAFNGAYFFLIDEEFNPIKRIGNYEELSAYLEK